MAKKNLKAEAYLLRIQTKLSERGIKLELDLNDFIRAVTDSHPSPQIRPVVMLCNDPEISKQKRRLEFISPEEIVYKTGTSAKPNIHETFSILPGERWRALGIRRAAYKAMGFL